MTRRYGDQDSYLEPAQGWCDRGYCTGWLGMLGLQTLYIEPGCLQKNGYCESFNAKLGGVVDGRDFLLGEGRANRDLAGARGIQHSATAFGAGLPVASATDLYPLLPTSTVSRRKAVM